MKKIAIYGKGGSGKSTISAALSVAYAQRGLKVLQVGCDPKADSTLVLTGGRRIPTLLELLSQGLAQPSPDQFIVPGRLGIDCVEAGGPTPGAGCGGRGIARMFELFDEIRLLEQRTYDVVLFDVLGDVVCGGFAAPLRHGFADRAFVVVSEEPLSLYAANNIIQAVDTYSSNGVRLGGVIMNTSDDLAHAVKVNRFAQAIGAPVVGIIPRDARIQTAEANHRSAVEIEDGPETVAAFQRLAQAVLDSCDSEGQSPRPLSVDELFVVLGRKAKEAPAPVAESSTGGVDSEGSVDEDDATPAREPSRTVPDRGRVVGGERACAAIAHLLAVDRGSRKAHEIKVTGFLVEDGEYRVELASPSFGELTVLLRTDGPEVTKFATAGSWAVSHGGEVSRRAEPLLDYVVKRLAKVRPEPALLAQALELDVGSVASRSAGGGRDLAGPIPRHWSVWGEESTQGLFFFDEERTRVIRTYMRLGGSRTFNIHHSSDVCQFSKQKRTLYSSHLVRPLWRAEHPEHEYAEKSDWVNTRLSEYDLIAGSNHVLEKALDMARAEQHDWDSVSIWISCSPEVAGEDWRGVVRRFREDFDGPVLTMGIGDGDVTEDMLAVARDVLRKRPLRRDVAPRPGTVHLVGFPPVRSTGELVKLLGAAGVEVGQRQLPVLYLGRIDEYGEAKAQLVWPVQEYQRLVDEYLSTFPVPVVEITPPFGVVGTRTFLEESRRAAGVGGELPGAVAAEFDAATRRLARLRKRAARHRIGIALSGRQGELAERPELLGGIPLRGLIESLGFQVEVLTDAQDEERLAWWLGSGLSAVCTEVQHDERLLAAGVGAFGPADLEAGLGGAVRSAERLLNVCETPLFAHFARFAGGGRRDGQ